jgi:IS30 family transposase
MPGHAVLTEEKLREIISLANRGLSRRAIARQVGCAAATIDNTAARRPEYQAHRTAHHPTAQHRTAQHEPLSIELLNINRST